LLYFIISNLSDFAASWINYQIILGMHPGLLNGVKNPPTLEHLVARAPLDRGAAVEDPGHTDQLHDVRQARRVLAAMPVGEARRGGAGARGELRVAPATGLLVEPVHELPRGLALLVGQPPSHFREDIGIRHRVSW